MRFLAVIVPMRKGDSDPTITPLGHLAIRVRFRGKTTSVSFDDAAQADIVVDTAAIRP